MYRIKKNIFYVIINSKILFCSTKRLCIFFMYIYKKNYSFKYYLYNMQNRKKEKNN